MLPNASIVVGCWVALAAKSVRAEKGKVNIAVILLLDRRNPLLRRFNIFGTDTEK